MKSKCKICLQLLVVKFANNGDKLSHSICAVTFSLFCQPVGYKYSLMGQLSLNSFYNTFYKLLVTY